MYEQPQDLEKYGIVKVSRQIGRAELYKLNLEHPLVEMLREYEKRISLRIAERKAVAAKL